MSRVSGHGQQRIEEMYRGQIIVPDLIPKMKIEIGVNDAFVDITVNAILKSARTNGEGSVGDGRNIFILLLRNVLEYVPEKGEVLQYKEVLSPGDRVP